MEGEHDRESGSGAAYLMTDIVGSTRRWEADPAVMAVALARHDELVEAAVSSQGGRVLQARGEGDSAFTVFPDAAAAARAAAALQRFLTAEPWPEGFDLQVRTGIHTAGHFRDDHFGPAVNRCARIRAAAHRGQVLLSHAAASVVREDRAFPGRVRSLGKHRLKDLGDPEEIFQLVYPELPDRFPPILSLETVPHNLPLQRSTFVGRDDSLREIRELLDSAVLVTLIGPGGAGKTRLALEVAGELLDRYPDGLWFVDLAPLSPDASVGRAVAAAIGVSERSDLEVTETLTARIRDRRMLLILDNCEHLIADCAAVADHLLGACSHLQVIATSREHLAITGERIFRVPSLRVPSRSDVRADEVVSYDAVRLLVERAIRGGADLALTDDNAAAVAELCRRLDGIPLALELAAARLRTMSAGEVVERLDERFDLLTAGRRTDLPRQKTLRALIDWSHDLLDSDEQAVFRRLSVFAGDFSLQAAEDVCSGGDLDKAAVLDLLARLVDKSLVVAEPGPHETRYRMLETIRQYAADRLDAAQEIQTLRRAHMHWYLAFSEATISVLMGPADKDALISLERELDNLRAALSWAVDTDPDVALRMTMAMSPAWMWRGRLVERGEWLRKILDTPDLSHRGRAAAKVAIGSYPFRDATYKDAIELVRGGLAELEALGDSQHLALGYAYLGRVLQESGSLEEAEKACRKSLELSSRTPSTEGYAWTTLAYVLVNRRDLDAARASASEALRVANATGSARLDALASEAMLRVALERGDHAEAALYGERARAAFEYFEDDLIQAHILVQIASAERRQGNLAQAAASLERALPVLALGGIDFETARGLFEAAAVAALSGRAMEAGTILGAARRLARRVGSADETIELAPAGTEALLRGLLEESEVAGAIDKGRALDTEAAVELAVRALADACSSEPEGTRDHDHGARKK